MICYLLAWGGESHHCRLGTRPMSKTMFSHGWVALQLSQKSAMV